MSNLDFLLRAWHENLRSSSNGDFRNQELPETLEFRDYADWARDNNAEPDLLYHALAEATGADWIDTVGFDASALFVAEYPLALAREKRVLCVERFHPANATLGKLTLLVCDEHGLDQLDHVRRLFDVNTQLAFTDCKLLEKKINESYESRSSTTMKTIDSLESRDDTKSALNKLVHEDVLDSRGNSPVVNLVNSLLFDAIKTKASDIHLQPYPKHLQVRFRIDGILFDQATIPKSFQEEVLSRVKILGKMDIAEKRLPQDGRTTVELGNRTIDLRIASLPTEDGERIVVRLLDQSSETFSLEELGMPANVLTQFRELINREHGIILVTGPTGSGKSTTLYASLQEINASEKNIVTLEDPIEYRLDRISQTQINEKKGLTFAKGLRNILRQDPDIIMVGEIRDRETAEMAIQSSLTGHLVFSTLHTNDAASAITRLFDLGIEPYLISSSLIGVMAQRLVRKLCTNCNSSQSSQTERHPNELPHVSEMTGCAECRQTGYNGRIGLFEFMPIDSDLQNLIQTQSNAARISQQAVSSGMTLLRTDGLQKTSTNQTTIAEVNRVTAQLVER